MKKKFFLTALCFGMSMMGTLAQSFPTISTDENTRWYLIQFVNGGKVIIADTPDTEITVGAATGGDSQLWKVTGNETDGYQFTNKKGYVLYVSSATKNEKLKSSATVSGVNRFTIVKGTNGYEVHPKGNANISINLWGGPNDNRGAGLWDNGDPNNPVNFNEPVTLSLHTENGSIDGPDNTALPLCITRQKALDVVLRGAPGYAAKGLTVRYGQNLNGEEFDTNDNRQWTETYVEAKNNKVTIPAEMTDGNVALYATFEPMEGNEWQLVFSDEFNTDTRTQPTNDKWMRCQRQGATWNRWLSNSEEVIYIEDGDLVARAIPNPDKASDNVPMITGGIKSMGKFGFTYGYVEARLLTNPWTGNFPAFWMMPEDQSLGWPDCGEIDIWEAIDNDTRSYHTIHSNWTYDLGYKGNPQSSFNTSVPYDRYHTYALEWDANTLIWYVDGKEIGRYTKSANSSHLNQGQWPFDKHFHLILNQSVGNGSWAANADVNHTYETRFDWVRVYQKTGMKNTDGIVTDITEVEQSFKDDSIYTLQGIRLDNAIENLPKGIYIVDNKKLYVK